MGTRKCKGFLAGVATVLVAAGMLTPAAAYAEDAPTGRTSSPTPSPRPSQSSGEAPTEEHSSSPSPAPSSSTSSASQPGPSPSKRPTKPSKPQPTGKPDPDSEKPNRPQPPKKKKKKKKEEKPEDPPPVDMAAVMATAESQLATAESDLARATAQLRQAKAGRDRAKQQIQSLGFPVPAAGTSKPGVPMPQTGAAAVPAAGGDSPAAAGGAESMLPAATGSGTGPVAESGLQGLQLALLPALTESNTSTAAVARQVLAARETITAVGGVNALVAAQTSLAKAQARVDKAQATYNLVRLNIATAKATLGLASGELSTEGATRQFSSYPVGDCSFPGVSNPNGCRAAQQWAIAQTVNPLKNWYYLCLNFVTIAYGRYSGAPTAISHWNNLPDYRKHSPNTVAPPGALMFWGPNHVALSLGNNVMVSTDVLGTGRAWIVSFETIQARWGFQYLGWAEPDFNL